MLMTRGAGTADGALRLLPPDLTELSLLNSPLLTEDAVSVLPRSLQSLHIDRILTGAHTVLYPLSPLTHSPIGGCHRSISGRFAAVARALACLWISETDEQGTRLVAARPSRADAA